MKSSNCRAENNRVANFANSIDQVIVRKDVINGKLVWYFCTRGKIIDLYEEKLDKSDVFFEKYIGAMGISIIPPYFDDREWRLFLELLKPKIIYERGSFESSFFQGNSNQLTALGGV